MLKRSFSAVSSPSSLAPPPPSSPSSFSPNGDDEDGGDTARRFECSSCKTGFVLPSNEDDNGDEDKTKRPTVNMCCRENLPSCVLHKLLPVVGEQESSASPSLETTAATTTNLTPRRAPSQDENTTVDGESIILDETERAEGFVESIHSLFPFLTSLDIRSKLVTFTMFDLRKVKVVTLTFSNYEDLEPGPTFAALLGGGGTGTYLRTLTLHSCPPKTMSVLFQSFPNIEDLTLRCIDEIPKEIGNLANLESLYIGNAVNHRRERTNIKRLPVEMQNLSKLKELAFEMCTRLKEAPFPIHKLSSLKTLIMVFCTSFDFKTFFSFEGDASNDTILLESLRLSENYLGLGDRGGFCLEEWLWPFVKRCPMLRELNLANNMFRNPKSLDGLLQMPSSSNLRILRLGCCMTYKENDGIDHDNICLRDDDDDNGSVANRNDDGVLRTLDSEDEDVIYQGRYGKYARQVVRVLEQHRQLGKVYICCAYDKYSKMQTLQKLNASGIRLLEEAAEERRQPSLWPFFLDRFLNRNDSLTRQQKLSYVYDQLRNGRALADRRI